jgi:pectate lyase
MKRLISRIAFSTLLSATAAMAQQQPILAFPGAQGFASHTPGGRGGRVVHVTNLNDSGPGSLRDAVSADHRIVVFDLSGSIMLKSVLQVASSITLAGQTAPGLGINICNAEVSLSNSHDLILRYLRIRQGLSPNEDKKSAINITSARDVILDHLTVNWGRWDTIDMNLCTNVTIQNCIVGEGVDPQRFGCLCQCDGVTFTHNLFINNQSRNPKAKGKIQYVNNVVYNWGVCGLVGGHSAADHTLDVIGNYFIAGPASSTHALGEFTKTDHVYSDGNYVDLNKDAKLSGRPVAPDDFNDGKGAPTLMPSATVTDGPPLTIDSAQVAYDKVIASAGDSLHRDAIDQRLIAEVQTLGTTGKIIHDPAEVGGFPQIPTVQSPAEIIHLGKSPDSDNLDKDGYTRVEHDLNELLTQK